MSSLQRFGLKEELISKINLVFSEYPEIDMALLYGSRAKGNFKPGSDIDLTLKGPALNTTHLLQIENRLDDLMLPYSIDLSLHSQIESPDLIDHIYRLGVVFYERASS